MAIVARETLPLADTIGLYLEEVSEHSLLSAADEVELARTIEVGLWAERQLDSHRDLDPAERHRLRELVQEGEEAKSVFIRSNLRLVISIAKRYAGRGLDLIDLIQEGNLGLIRAVEKFDWRKGFKFLHLRHVVDPPSDNPWPGKPGSHHQAAGPHGGHSTNRQGDLHAAGGGVQAASHPRGDRRSERLGRGTGQRRTRRSEQHRVAGRPVGEDGEAVLGDFVEDSRADDPFVQAALAVRRGHIDDALNVLEPDERLVIVKRYGLGGTEPQTLTAIGEMLGTTRERVRQIEKRALAKLRHPLVRLRPEVPAGTLIAGRWWVTSSLDSLSTLTGMRWIVP